MSGKIEAHLKKLNLELPTPAKPAANYVPFVTYNGLVYVSGQLPLWKGKPKITGKVGKDLKIDEAQEAAGLCLLNVLAQLKIACQGDLDKITKCIRLTRYVNATDDFSDHPQVINGASDILKELFGDIGAHSRAAIGVSSLPFNVPVEIDGIFALS